MIDISDIPKKDLQILVNLYYKQVNKLTAENLELNYQLNKIKDLIKEILTNLEDEIN